MADDRLDTPVAPNDADRAAVPGDAGVEPASPAPPRYRGWFWFGIVLQVFVWTLIWLGIAIAIGVGGELTEFRYVGF
jgi:hypothetical protein